MASALAGITGKETNTLMLMDVLLDSQYARLHAMSIFTARNSKTFLIEDKL